MNAGVHENVFVLFQESFNATTIFLQLTYPEFSFESEAKGNSLLGVHQTRQLKIGRVLTTLTRALS